MDYDCIGSEDWGLPLQVLYVFWLYSPRPPLFAWQSLNFQNWYHDPRIPYFIQLLSFLIDFCSFSSFLSNIEFFSQHSQMLLLRAKISVIFTCISSSRGSPRFQATWLKNHFSNGSKTSTSSELENDLKRWRGSAIAQKQNSIDAVCAICNLIP